MNQGELNLLRNTVGTEPARLCLRTRMRVDAGRWWRSSPVWLCVVGDQLVTLAAARHERVQVLPIDDCSESTYCPASGQLVLAPAEAPLWPRIDLSPSHALLVLRAFNTPDPEPRPLTTPH